MHTPVIIAAQVKDAANAAAKASFAPDGGERTFTIGLVTPPDMEAVTHYWCAATFSAEKRALLSGMALQAPFAGNVHVWDYDGAADPEFPHRTLSEPGLSLHQP